MSVWVCDRLYVSEPRREVTEISELVFISVIVIVAEAVMLISLGRYTKPKWGDEGKGDESRASGDVRFWQNIISYDHKKGGDKE